MNSFLWFSQLIYCFQEKILFTYLSWNLSLFIVKAFLYVAQPFTHHITFLKYQFPFCILFHLFQIFPFQFITDYLYYKVFVLNFHIWRALYFVIRFNHLVLNFLFTNLVLRFPNVRCRRLISMKLIIDLNLITLLKVSIS